jgi:hypothetical protein
MSIRHIYILLVLHSVLNPSFASLTILGSEGVKVDIKPIQNGIEWQRVNETDSFHIINLSLDRSVFDFCDLTQYTVEGVLPLLKAHGNLTSINNENGERTTSRWAAAQLFKDRSRSLSHLCSGSTSWHYSYVLYNDQLLVSYIQNAGGIGLITSKESNVPQKYWSFDEMDKTANTVFGKKLNSFAIGIENQIAVDFLVDLFDRSLVGSSPTPVVASSLTEDYNNMDEAIDNYFSLFRICGYILCPLAMFCMYYSINVTRRYYEINGGRLRVNYCTFSLMMTIMANTVRIVRAVDVLGYQGLIPFFYARPFYTFPNTIGLCSSLATLFFWIETNIRIQLALELKVFRSRRRLKIVTVTLAFMLIFVDVYISVASVFGTLQGNTALIPSVAFLIFGMGTATTTLKMTRSIQITSRNLLSSIQPLTASTLELQRSTKAQSPSNKCQGTSEKTAHPSVKAVSVKVITPASYGGATNQQHRHSEAAAMKYYLIEKLESARRLMTACGVATLLLTLSTAALGTNLQYSGPNQLAMYMLVPILDQITSHLEMKVIAVSIEKIGTS